MSRGTLHRTRPLYNFINPSSSMEAEPILLKIPFPWIFHIFSTSHLIFLYRKSTNPFDYCNTKNSHCFFFNYSYKLSSSLFPPNRNCFSGHDLRSSLSLIIAYTQNRFQDSVRTETCVSTCEFPNINLAVLRMRFSFKGIPRPLTRSW